MGLKKLRTLEIKLNYFPEACKRHKLAEILDCIAGSSDLHSLPIQDVRKASINWNSDIWLPAVINHHGRSLKKLLISQVRPDLKTTRTLFNYRDLETL